MKKTRRELISLTKKLIRFKTISNNKKEIRKCLNFIQSYFKNTDLQINTLDSKGVVSLLVSNVKTKRPDLLLNGHIDVVNGSNDQFFPKIKFGRIYGRGAIDMKGSIAVMMLLMKNLARGLPKKIAAIFVSDEEFDGENGTKFILTKGLRPKFTIITEESNFDIVVQQKGGFILDIETYGKKAHSAEAWKGENAIDKAIEIYQSLKRAVGPNKSAFFKPTINIGKFNGGINANFVADFASFEVDIRFTNKINEKRIVDQINSLKKRKDVRIVIKSRKTIMKSIRCKKEIEILKQLVEEIIRKKPLLKKTPYAGDGRFFSDYNLPVVEFGPVGANYHADNEYVEIKSLIKYLEILQKFIKLK